MTLLTMLSRLRTNNPKGLGATLTKNRLEIQLKRVNLALNEIEKNRLLGEEHVGERRSANAAQHKEARRLDEI